MIFGSIMIVMFALGWLAKDWKAMALITVAYVTGIIMGLHILTEYL